VFTTLLLRATQHTTGLMVKVAPLLPPRGLLPSQRQLRWTHTFVLPIVGLDIVIISSGNSVVLRFGLDEQNQTLVLNIYLYQKAKQQFRRTNLKFPTIGNTCSLAAIFPHIIKHQNNYE